VLSILIPVFNEQDNLQSIYDRLLAVIIPLNLDYELLFINDGSTDNSLAIIKGFESINKM
jgi:glycosyltransferase involved in cell wall biosynthesis